MPKAPRAPPSSGSRLPASSCVDSGSIESCEPHAALAVQSHEAQFARLPRALSPRLQKVQEGPR